MSRIKVEVINTSNNELPQYKTPGSSGMDIRADLSSLEFDWEGSFPGFIAIPPGERMVVPTGLFLAIPEDYEIQIRPRSGLAAKEGVTVLNTPGTIDSDYRGEVKVILHNAGSEMVRISHGDRIAQMVLQHVPKMYLSEVKELNETERGEGGFGSTGK